MELLLFGRILENISLKEALYILNEDNYKKNIFQFKEDFEKLNHLEEKKEDYKVTGEFEDYYNDLLDNLLNEQSNLSFFISLEESNQNFYIESYDNDLIFGDGYPFDFPF